MHACKNMNEFLFVHYLDAFKRAFIITYQF